jgi:OOP family OmpA-OmpF porin
VPVKRILLLILLACGAAAVAQPARPRDSVNLEPWFVFFDRGSAAIEPPAAAVLDNFANTIAGQSWNCSIQIDGHTDRMGAEDYNFRLGLKRAKAVIAYLRRKHVTVALEPRSDGETRPLVETADGVPDAQNRRVEWSACM